MLSPSLKTYAQSVARVGSDAADAFRRAFMPEMQSPANLGIRRCRLRAG